MKLQYTLKLGLVRISVRGFDRGEIYAFLCDNVQLHVMIVQT